MTNEMIDKYLDQQGITDKDLGVDTLLFSEPSSNPYVLVIANSRKSLRDWIMVAWDITKLDEKIDNYIDWQYQEILELATENIEASLGKTWSQVRAELEGMEG